MRVREADDDMGSMDAETFDGGCTCRCVRYRLDRVSLQGGEVERIDTPSSSGRGQKISRCPKCRVALWSHYAGGGDAVSFVRVGTLDEPDRFPPGIHIFTASKQPWVVLPPGTPAVAAYHDAQAVWPPQSLARRAALQAKRQPPT